MNTTTPVHHHTFHQPTTTDHSKYVAACHQCDWSVTGTQTETSRWRQQHETEESTKVAEWWAAR